MNSKVGVWIDHREAILVRQSDSGEETIRIQSGAESQLRRSSDPPTGRFEPINVPSDDIRQHKYTADLNTFYDEVISYLSKAQSVFICGPGEARKELKNRMEAKHPAGGSVVLEAADSMSEAQVVAKIRQHFQTQ